MSHFYDFDHSDLDEFLVEYVDGTMDPVVREAFEEFLHVYPEVAAHVDCLASVRNELCKLGDDCRCNAPPGFQARLKRQLACEVTITDSLEQWTPQLNIIALAFSIAILAFAVGLSNLDSDEFIADADSGQATEWVGPSASPLETVELARATGYVQSASLTGPIEKKWAISRTHQVSMASTFSTVFDRPMLMSVRHNFIGVKPLAVPLAVPLAP